MTPTSNSQNILESELLASVRRILVLYPRRIGDWVVLTPFLRALRKRFPQAQITAIGSFRCREIFPLIPFCDRFDFLGKPQDVFSHARLFKTLMSEPWDILIDPNADFSRTSWLLCRLTRARVKMAFDRPKGNSIFTHLSAAPDDDESMISRYERLARKLGAAYEPVYELRLPKDEEALAHDRARSLSSSGRAKILIHPGNPKRESSLWPMAGFSALAMRLRRDFDIFFMAGPGEEKEVAHAAQAAGLNPSAFFGPRSFVQVAALMREADVFVSSLTGTSHTAAALGIPTFTFYTGYTWKVWRIPGEIHGGIPGPWSDCRTISVEDAETALRRHISAIGDRKPRSNSPIG